MNTRLPTRRRLTAGLLAAALLITHLTGCGGGVDSGGTGIIASGPISGLGSIFVNDVRFDDDSAEIRDEQGALLTKDQLKLGMTVIVEGGTLDTRAAQATSTAQVIRVVSDLVGPVGAVDAAAGSFTVLGQTVIVGARTLFDGSLTGGFSALVPGMTVQVYSQYDPLTRQYAATRIEQLPDATFFKIRGVVAARDPQAPSLTLGSEVIGVGGVAGSAVPPVDIGDFLSVRLLAESGQLAATSVRTADLMLGDHPVARVEGTVTEILSSRSFKVNGIAVDAVTAHFDGDEAKVVLGARVGVLGSTLAGTLVAARVIVHDDSVPAIASFALVGAVQELDAVTRSFRIRNTPVVFDDGTAFSGGAAADLANGRLATVSGLPSLDGTRIVATQVTFAAP
ncbi:MULTISPECIES: DUF5666 domain-containing protein [unclassified Rhizobacter]|uniref:DUF5666 domain-containing protein n=1 Tax=unclassified Rhizobacter TaxID=2640088 RepID=UPI0006F544A7|nr:MULTISPECIES: DUF5666 domain-containing protein [unclassified Rhizobacter]KQU67137.1 hypothetical protein ASC88_08980 [Rhizobacter sp. Root29]KQV98152.1 hypothetical protein ASC98_09085 [Rhizobacter sp. Root1238]KRB02050.1 hypothetical protein ASE08_16645 [Rhizobacter sp. Root16D2]